MGSSEGCSCSALGLWSKRSEVRFPYLAALISEIGYLLLLSRDMVEISLKRGISSNQLTNVKMTRFFQCYNCLVFAHTSIITSVLKVHVPLLIYSVTKISTQPCKLRSMVSKFYLPTRPLQNMPVNRHSNWLFLVRHQQLVMFLMLILVLCIFSDSLPYHWVKSRFFCLRDYANTVDASVHWEPIVEIILTWCCFHW